MENSEARFEKLGKHGVPEAADAAAARELGFGDYVLPAAFFETLPASELATWEGDVESPPSPLGAQDQ